jgi:hypothetical protein
MGFALFDKANLAVIAYAKVAADGTIIEASNLEYLTPHIPGTGTLYVLGPPFNIDGVREPLFDSNTICILTAYEQMPLVLPVVSLGPPYSIAISFWPLYVPGPPVEKAFSIVVLRPLIKTP